MHCKEEVIAFCLSLPGSFEDYPFHDENWAVLRHRENGKSFALVFHWREHDCINVKCSPEWTAFWRGTHSAVLPGYHMNKTHWNTIICDGSVPADDIRQMISDSYRLTLPKTAKPDNKANLK